MQESAEQSMGIKYSVLLTSNSSPRHNFSRFFCSVGCNLFHSTYSANTTSFLTAIHWPGFYLTWALLIWPIHFLLPTPRATALSNDIMETLFQNFVPWLATLTALYVGWRLWAFTISPALHPNDPKPLPYPLPCKASFLANIQVHPTNMQKQSSAMLLPCQMM